jgi:hypothetical protein
MELGLGRLERVRGVRKVGAREYTFTLTLRYASQRDFGSGDWDADIDNLTDMLG